jgi:hypothetical protein
MLTMEQRGYGAVHYAVRKRLKPFVDSGMAHCARCGMQIKAGEPWDLGHTEDRMGWSGPEHRACNRATAAHRVRKRSRRW